MQAPQNIESAASLKIPPNISIIAGQGLTRNGQPVFDNDNPLFGIAQQSLSIESYTERSPRTILVATKGYLAIRAVDNINEVSLAVN